jgi:hypothetical protein
MNRAAILAALALLAAGCTEEAAAPAKQGARATGEVLGGEISDAMIPLEQLESQAPLAPRQGPTASDVDAEQPEIEPAAGVDGAAPSEGAEPAPVAPVAQPEE